MSDYTKVYDGAAKDTAGSTITGADFDFEFDAIETAVATKANKVVSATLDNLLAMDANGDLKDSAIVTNTVVTLAGVQALSNKTHESPVINTGVSGSAIDTDTTLAANSDTLLVSQKAVKTYIEATGVSARTEYDLAGLSNKDIALPTGWKKVSFAMHELDGSINGAQCGIQVKAGGSWRTVSGYTNNGIFVAAAGNTLSGYANMMYLFNVNTARPVSGEATVLDVTTDRVSYASQGVQYSGGIYIGAGQFDSAGNNVTDLRLMLSTGTFVSGRIAVTIEY